MSLKDDAGLVKMYAMVNVQQYQIVATGTTVAECEQSYRDLLVRQGLSELEEVHTTETRGMIEDIRSAVLDGTSYYYIRLQGNNWYYIVSAQDNALAVILNVGDTVTLTTVSNETGELRSAVSVRRR